MSKVYCIVAVALTLFVNAGAVLQFKGKEREPSFEDAQPGIVDKFHEILKNLRVLRLAIVLWNCLVIALMFVLF